MSQENVEIVKAAFEAWNRGDLDGWLAEADPEIEWLVLPEVLEYIDAGEYVIVPTRMRARPPGSDADIVLDEVYVSKFRNSKIVELREYRTKPEALEAVGLRE